jgi:O-antigen/teichoic acid export membrane protein
VLSGSFFVQCLGVIIVPTLVFAYSAEDVGYYGMFFSVSAMLSVVISLRMENLFFSIDKVCISPLFSVIVFVSCALLSFFLGVVALWGAFFTLPDYVVPALLCGFSIALFNAVYSLAVRVGLTDTYVRAKVIRALIELVFVVGCAFLKVSIYSLVYFVPFSYFLAAIYLVIKGEGLGFGSLLPGLAVAVERKNILFYDFFASIFNVMVLYLPVMFFYFKGGEAIAGVYFAVSRFVGVPLLMVAQAVGTSLKQVAVDEYDSHQRVSESMRKIINYIFLKPRYFYALALLCYAGVLADQLMTERWEGAGWVTIFVIPLFVIRFFYNCISPVLYVLGMQQENMLFQLCMLVLGGGGLYISAVDIVSVALYSCVLMVLYVGFAGYLISCSFSKVRSVR